MMGGLVNLIDLIFHLASLLFLIRFLLQASSADYYNSLSQAIIKATDKLANPLRGLLKPYKNLDLASIAIAYLFSVAFYFAIFAMMNTVPTWSNLLVMSLARTGEIVLSFYWWSILATIIASYFAQQGVHPAIALLQDIVEPILEPARRLIPALGPLDLSPILVIFTISLLQNFLKQIT